MASRSSQSAYQQLDMGGADFQPLSPVNFIRRSAYIFRDKTAIVYGDRRYSYAEFGARCEQLASAIIEAGIEPGDTVSVICPNVPEMLELHFAVPMTGAVLNTINTRLDAKTVATILDHGDSKMLFVDREYADVAETALSLSGCAPIVIGIDDPTIDTGRVIGDTDYNVFLSAGGDTPRFEVTDETMAISLSYTSGTTGNPKGVVYSHRGAALNGLGNIMALGLTAKSTYLWTLPLFHCNGWTHPWAVTAIGATHICLRVVDPAEIFRLIAAEKVTHMAAAPVVLSMLIHAPEPVKLNPAPTPPVQIATGGAAPPSKVIDDMETMGFNVIHLYGLTETYGPSLICEMQSDWEELPLAERAQKMARQGVPHVLAGEFMVADPETLTPVPADGKTIGEIMIRGNIVMKGYLKNQDETARASFGGWFHSGDLAVMHADGYAEVKDRSKDIIISGGENISSLEVEEALYKHPDVMEAAVVARPDEKWGETPCAFVTLKPGSEVPAIDDLVAFCRKHLAGYKVPKHFVFDALPKTQTGKIQKTVLRERAKDIN